MKKSARQWKDIRMMNAIVLMGLVIVDSFESTPKSKRLIEIQKNTIKAIKKLDKRKPANLIIAGMIITVGVRQMELIQSQPIPKHGKGGVDGFCCTDAAVYKIEAPDIFMSNKTNPEKP